ncbi:aminotransferase class I/II-fold pyridoxal phosphate-dependent enzyme [Aspergillus luchuensis]|uniref:Putative secondary metabolism biosynthetic enzyme n=1 Tax=Aspergillus kawachii TaxID=1069201 RepID=A0A7R7VYA7_ASPKA|nr:putative secondary metabolism biosynthetic enzyme [Aspergillus luchuensis]BCR92996.1 putative secondary metabolism biosynthetic enzyme [Aspergillus luchuensis]
MCFPLPVYIVFLHQYLRRTHTMSDSFIVEWARAQQPKAPSMKNASVFYRNLEEELDVRRAQHGCIMLHTKEQTSMVDFSSTDILGLSTSGSVRKGYLDELAKHPDFKLSSHGSRLTDGNSKYLEDVERELAAFHGAEAGLIVNTGSLGNAAIFSVIPRPGDAIVYDELIHASVHDGMKDSLALYRKAFRHNDSESLYDALVAVQESQPQIRNGTRSVLVAVESVYSMDGDICPLQELIETAKEVFPEGNVQFVIDEAHSTGVIGPNGAGLVSALGLESEVAIRLHTFGKALAATGAVILCNETVRTMLINYARSIMFSVAPSFPMLASIRATYQLLRSGETQGAQNRVHEIVKFFLETMTSDPIWSKASDTGLLRLPTYEDADVQPRRCPASPHPDHPAADAYQAQLLPCVPPATGRFLGLPHLVSGGAQGDGTRADHLPCVKHGRGSEGPGCCNCGMGPRDAGD